MKLGVESRIVSSTDGLNELGDLENCVVHIHGLWLGLQHRAAKLARASGARVVWSTHGMTAPWALHHKWWKKMPVWWLYQRRDLLSADLVHSTTEQEVAWNRACGLDRQCCVPLGTDLPREEGVVGSCSRRAAVRTLLFVGRIYPVKAIDRIIAAFGRVKTSGEGVGWRLRIVGPDQAGHLAELQGLAGADVDFVGPKFGAELDAEYATCDCAILASHTENFGATIVDAMAHGKPVIAGTKTPWRIVQERGCGWWVDNEPASLAQAMREMMALSDAQRGELGAKGRRLVEERYTWEAVGRMMRDVYGKVLAE